MDGNRRQRREVEEEEDHWLADKVAMNCFDFLGPLLEEFDKKLDVRLVRTMADAVTAIVRHRNRPLALLLSELGAVIDGQKHGPAGTKRLANLIHSHRWEAEDIQGHRLAGLSAALGKDRLLHVWDRGFSGAAWLGEALLAGRGPG